MIMQLLLAGCFRLPAERKFFILSRRGIALQAGLVDNDPFVITAIFEI